MKFSDFMDILPSLFDKEEKSNISKLMLIFSDQFEIAKNILEDTMEWRDIENAKGTTLDELGHNVGQSRGKTSDAIYRVLIRGKVARNSSDGTINKIITALSVSLNCPPSAINIISANETEDQKEPAAIIIKKIPIDYLNQSGLTISQFLQITRSITAGGVRLAYVSLDGTFSFSSTKEVEVSKEGFADIKETTGGTLSGVFIPDDDYKLPI